MKLNVIDFLRDTGRCVRIGDMLSRTSVVSRMETSEGLSFTEFSYQVCLGEVWCCFVHFLLAFCSIYNIHSKSFVFWKFLTDFVAFPVFIANLYSYFLQFFNFFIFFYFLLNFIN